MPFTNSNQPISFKIQSLAIKNKAIEIANSLIKMDYEKNVAEAIAFSNAKLWSCYSFSNEGDVSRKDRNVHVVPHPDGWALISEDASVIYFVLIGENEVLNKARCFAKNEKVKLYIHNLSGNISDTESFVVNRPVVVPEHQRDHSAIRSKEQESPSFTFESRREAVRKEKWLAKKVHTNLVIHNKSGDIEKKLSLGI